MEQLLQTFDINTLDAQMIIVWAVVFVVIWKGLAKKVFSSLLVLVEAREAAVSGASQRAKTAREEAAQLSSSIEESLAITRAEAMKLKNEKISESRAKAQDLVDSAAHDAAKQLESGRGSIKEWINSANNELARECGDIAEQVVNQVRSKVLLQ